MIKYIDGYNKGEVELGITLVLISTFLFSLSSYLGKIVTNTTSMSGVITSFSRFFIGAVFMFIYMLATKKSFKPSGFRFIVGRSIFSSLGIIFVSAALNYTTITNANMLNMTYPIFVVLVAPILLKEKIKKSTYFYLVAMMLGSYIVADPQFGNINRGDLLGFVSAIFTGISILSLKEARKSNEGYLIVFYVMLIGTIINIPFSIRDIVNFDYSALSYVLISGVIGFLAQIFLTEGYKYVDSSIGSLVSSSRIVFSAILGVLFLNEPFNLRIILGILLIGGSLVGISGYLEKRKERRMTDNLLNKGGH